MKRAWNGVRSRNLFWNTLSLRDDGLCVRTLIVFSSLAGKQLEVSPFPAECPVTGD